MRWFFISHIDGGVAGWSYGFGIYITLIEMNIMIEMNILIEMNIVIVILMSVILIII